MKPQHYKKKKKKNWKPLLVELRKASGINCSPETSLKMGFQ
jgi:hypothetical protein